MDIEKINTSCKKCLVDTTPFYETKDGYKLYSTTDHQVFCVKAEIKRPFKKFKKYTDDSICEAFKHNSVFFEEHQRDPLITTREHSFSGKVIKIINFKFKEEWKHTSTDTSLMLYSKNLSNDGFIKCTSELIDGVEHLEVWMKLDEDIKSKVLMRIVIMGLFNILSNISFNL